MRTHAHTLAITLSETRYCNLLLITLHVPYNEAFPEVCHFDCIFSSIHSTPPSIPLKHAITLTKTRTNFPRIQQPPQNYGRQKGDMKPVVYHGPKYIRRQRSQLSRHDSCTSDPRSVVRPVLTQTARGASSMSSHQIVKVNFTPEQATKALKGSRDTTLFFH